MSRHARALTLVALLLVPLAVARAEESLTLSQVLDTVLQRNGTLQVARNEQSAAAHANSLGNAGFLPTLDAVAGATVSRNDLEQTLSGGATSARDGAESRATNAGLRLGWTLFDGGRMFLAKSRLDAEEAVASTRLKASIESTVGTTIAAYFEVVRLQQSARVLDGAIAINEERVRLARTRFETGAASKLDFLQAQVDLDARRSDRARLQITLETAMGRVNELMGVPTFRMFTATDSIRLEYPRVDARATAALLERNAEVRLGREQLRANERRLGEARALAWPRVVGGLQYGTSYGTNDFGSVLDSRTTGMSGSLALTWTLFDGWTNATQVTRARLQASSTRAQLETTLSRVQQSLVVARHRYASDTDIVALERERVELARENAEVALEAYRAGSISGLQLREAQNSHQQALEGFINASYQAKLSEVELMRINGDLVK